MFLHHYFQNLLESKTGFIEDRCTILKSINSVCDKQAGRSKQINQGYLLTSVSSLDLTGVTINCIVKQHVPQSSIKFDR